MGGKYSSNKSQPPVIPYGTIIPDPILFCVEPQHPWVVHIDLEICYLLDETFEKGNGAVCHAYWDEEWEFPPLPVGLFMVMFLAERLVFSPGQLRRLYDIKNESEIVRFIRKDGLCSGPGRFCAIPVDQTLEEYWEGYPV